MRKWLTVLSITTFLSFPVAVLADGNHSTPDFSNVQSNDEPSNHHGQMLPEPSSEQHADMSEIHTRDHTSGLSPEKHQNMQPESSTNKPSESEGGGHSHGGGTVIEIPPNYKVLDAFAAVNAGFLLIGLRNKWFKKKALRGTTIAGEGKLTRCSTPADRRRG